MRFTARSPADVLAVVPLVLGFEPSESLVMLTFGTADQFHCRVDLPDPSWADPPLADQLDALAESMLMPALRHRVEAVVLVVYTTDAVLARQVARSVGHRLKRARIRVIDLLRADGERWYPLGRSRAPVTGVPYDTRGHAFRAASVLAGNVTLGSREELAASVRPVPARVAETAAALATAPVPSGPGLERLLQRGRETAGLPAPAVASVLAALRHDARILNRIWSGMARPEAARDVRLWRAIVRATPDSHLADPAALLAFAAWLAGEGALAWCAIEQCHRIEPEHGLAGLVADLLHQAVSPRTWPESLSA